MSAADRVPPPKEPKVRNKTYNETSKRSKSPPMRMAIDVSSPGIYSKETASNMSQPVHLSWGNRQGSPSPLNTRLSAVSMSGAGPTPLLYDSKSTHRPSAWLRMPLLSNLRPFSVLQYLRRSRWNVLPPDHPSTAHPTVFQGLMIMSTRRCGALVLSV